VIGLPLLGQGEDWAHFDSGNGSLFELFSGGKAVSQPKISVQQSLVLGIRVDNLEATIAELRQRGVQFIGEVGEFEGTRWVPFVDPEGNQLEIKEIPN
jgi:predicted enzyme related to lactoylglutathione lyase